MSGRAILVTGGAGYIGSHACAALVEAGYTPVTYDDLSTGHRWAVQFGPFEPGDITDAARLRSVMQQYDFAGVMHFAARASVAESVAQPELYHRINVCGTQTLLDAMVERGLKHIVFSSSCAVYGIPPRVPITEDTPHAPVSPYGETKHLGEMLMQRYSTEYGVRAAMLRYFNAAGADPAGRIGEDHTPETHLIPLVLQTALGLRTHISIFGQDYPTNDGTAVRDYIHVQDLAQYHVMALERLLAGAENFAVNLGTGTGYSVAQIVAEAARVTGRAITTQQAPRRAGDPPALVSDVTFSDLLFHYRPERSDLPTLLSDAWHWHQKQHGGNQ
jgi:UDP-arabinose 4-epimerase